MKSIYIFAFGESGVVHIYLPDEWRAVAELLFAEAFVPEGTRVRVAASVLRDRLLEALELLKQQKRTRYMTVAQTLTNLTAFVEHCELAQAQLGRGVDLAVFVSQSVRQKQRGQKKKES